MPLRTPVVRWSGLFAVVLPAALAASLALAPAAAQAADLTRLQTLLYPPPPTPTDVSAAEQQVRA